MDHVSTEKLYFDRKEYTNDLLISLYLGMLKPRLVEEKMLILLRQGKISKWFSGIGQEAVSVGIMTALEKDEYVLPMHRNLGVFTTRDIPLYRLFSQWQGKANGFTNGRDRSFHFGTTAYHTVGMISHLGPQMGVACGIALGNVLGGEEKVTAVFTGEGGTSEGDFHEALNIASVWNLPILFCVENNGYGLSTPTDQQYNCKNLADRGIGYGMDSHIVEGNNILEVYTKVKELRSSILENPRPILIEFKTFRIRGHEEASGVKYVPEALIQSWKAKDPIDTFRQYLLDLHIISPDQDEAYRNDLKKEIDSHWEKTNLEEVIYVDKQKELSDVYASHVHVPVAPLVTSSEIRFIDAISDGLKASMQRFDNLVIMGQDIADYGGVFKITEGFLDIFGSKRVRNTPICESAIVSTAYGLSVKNYKAIVEMQFADFVSSGFNPIVNLLAKSHYRWGQPADVVIRMPCGAGVGAGPFHSQTNEAWFTKTPGLKVVYPAFPLDAKGLLISSIEDPNPVLFFEHKALYRSVRQEVPEGYYNVPLGKAALLRKGNEVTVISYGAAIHWALETLNKHSHVSTDLIDLRTLQPLDTKMIFASVKKTGKVIILQEDTIFGGIASDISALITENCFRFLDAPILRVGSMQTPIPFDGNLESQYLAKNTFEDKLLELIAY